MTMKHKCSTCKYLTIVILINDFIPIIDELFHSKTIIFLVFSDADANIIGVNKVSYNSMYDIVK